MDTTQPCGFMRLPPEMRCEIYRYLLQSHAPTTWASPQILRTCKTIYEEASQLLYKLNTIPLIFEPDRLVLDRHSGYNISHLPSHSINGGMFQNSLNPTTTSDPNDIELSPMLKRCENLEVTLPIWLLCCPEYYDFERDFLWLCNTLSTNGSFRSLTLVFDWRLPRSLLRHIEGSERTDNRRRYLIGILGTIRGVRKVGDIPIHRTCCL